MAAGKNEFPKFNPGKWKYEIKYAVPWLFDFDPQPYAASEKSPETVCSGGPGLRQDEARLQLAAGHQRMGLRHEALLQHSRAHLGVNRQLPIEPWSMETWTKIPAVPWWLNFDPHPPHVELTSLTHLTRSAPMEFQHKPKSLVFEAV